MRLLPGPSGLLSVDDAMKIFTKKFRDKSGIAWDVRVGHEPKPGKYTVVEIDYDAEDEQGEAETSGKRQKVGDEDEDEEKEVPPSKLDERVQELIKMIFSTALMSQTLVEMEYDLEQLPLGRLKKSTIEQAYQYLKEIEALLKEGRIDRKALKEASNAFYSHIPHNYGMKRPPVIDNLKLLNSKRSLVETLGDIEIATSILNEQDKISGNPIDLHYDGLRCTVKPLASSEREYQVVSRYVEQTHGPTHDWYSLEVKEVFKVQRHGEMEAFEATAGDIDNHMFLWHGSRLTNIVGILSQGLRIAPPEAPSTGYMFGKGLYFADMVTKSANYCHASEEKPEALIILARVALGKTYDVTAAEYMDKPPRNFNSTRGLGKHVPNPKDTEELDGALVPLGAPVRGQVQDTALMYNEYIVYDPRQVVMEYVLRLRWNFDSS